MQERQETENRIKTHSSGIQYYEIKLYATEGGEEMCLRLFESDSAARLKWEDDEENFDEYRTRRKYMQQAKKNRKAGQMIWNSAWGTMDVPNALRVQAAINEGKSLDEIGKM